MGGGEGCGQGLFGFGKRCVRCDFLRGGGEAGGGSVSKIFLAVPLSCRVSAASLVSVCRAWKGELSLSTEIGARLPAVIFFLRFLKRIWKTPGRFCWKSAGRFACCPLSPPLANWQRHGCNVKRTCPFHLPAPSPDAGHGVSQLRSAARAQTSANSQLREAQASPAGARAQRGGSLCRRRVPDLAAAGRAVARTMVVEGSAAP